MRVTVQMMHISPARREITCQVIFHPATLIFRANTTYAKLVAFDEVVWARENALYQGVLNLCLCMNIQQLESLELFLVILID